jgi:hypothetical protein
MRRGMISACALDAWLQGQFMLLTTPASAWADASSAANVSPAQAPERTHLPQLHHDRRKEACEGVPSA